MIPRLNELEPATATTRGFLAALRSAGFSGDLADDLATRVVGATDNSIYQILPQAIVYPRTAVHGPGDRPGAALEPAHPAETWPDEGAAADFAPVDRAADGARPPGSRRRRPSGGLASQAPIGWARVAGARRVVAPYASGNTRRS